MPPCTGDKNALVEVGNLPQACANGTSLSHILTIVFTTIGALALLMVVITGFRYVLSQGDPNKTADLRRQMVYLVVGLILAVSADLIVTFVVGRL